MLVEKGSLKHLLRKVNNTDIGICGSVINDYYDKNKLQSYGGSIYSFFSGRAFKATKIDIKRNKPNHIFYVSGAAMLVKREFIEKVGLLNEEYFLYCEEIDWIYKSNESYKIDVAENSIVYHKEGATIGTQKDNEPGSPLSEYYQARSKLIFTRKYVPEYLNSVSFFLLLRAGKHFLKGNWEESLSIAKALMNGK